MSEKKQKLSRRSFFIKSSAATAALGAGGLITNDDLEAITNDVNTNSQPSELRITDMRVVSLGNRHIIRLDTNQGIHGYGECRDGSSKTYALMLKSRVVGENPCNVDKIFRKLKQFGYHARQSAGPVSVEMACWDLAGKAWGVPCWQMLGGKFRDRIRMYADTPRRNDPVQMGNALKQRMDKGFTFLKMDISIDQLRRVEDALSWPKGGGSLEISPFQQWSRTPSGTVAHPFTGIRITEKGLKHLEDYTAAIREVVGWEVPIATDHYGHAVLEDQIKMAQMLDKFNLAWLEDCVPWYFTDQYVKLKNSCNTPILTGEDMYLKESFMELFEKQAISICHPDLATSGGLLETKKIGDLAMEYGVGMAMHMAGNPVTMFSSIHCAAATENFMVMEHHNPDDQWYDDMVIGPEKPLMDEEGFVPVPDTPGLGIELNEEVVKSMLKNPDEEYFAPTPEWDNETSHDRLWSKTPPVNNTAKA